MKIFFQILLPIPVDKSFTYWADDSFDIGCVVLVEFRHRQIWGVIVDILPDALQQLASEKIKKIIDVHPLIKLSGNHLKFIFAIASYNLALPGLVLKSFIGILNSDKTQKANKLLAQEIKIANFALKQLTVRQEEILNRLLEVAYKSLSANEITTTAPVNANSQSQSNLNWGEGNRVAMLDGVTGSGKTEIYFALIAKILERDPNSQILILLPEIALTSQLLERFVEQFDFEPALWHSKISKKSKREIFFATAKGSLRVMIGARSALLLPFKNLQLIVIDEEHDNSFRQEEIFNFHARDMAILRGKIENFLVILSSATPSLETYYNAKIGKFQNFLLDQKFGSRNIVEMVDMRQEKLGRNHFLSSKLRVELAQNLEMGQQSLLFLNRRGYAPVSLCKSCGQKYGCPNCDSYLVLHKELKASRLICHHCGYSELSTNDCKFCGEKDSLLSIGAGIEKVSEEVKSLFSGAKIILVDSDNVASFAEAKQFVARIASGDADIIIGTQMIAKGYDFANLTLVGIVDADSMLYSSDLRALERAFQTLTQVIGRSGRRQKIGKVMIQSFEPQNLLFEKILKGDKQEFYEFELQNRKMSELPPFAQMMRFEISAIKEDEAKIFAKKLLRSFPQDDRIEIYGPAPAAMQKVKNRHNFWLHLKIPKKLNLQKLITDVLLGIEIPRSIRLRININP